LLAKRAKGAAQKPEGAEGGPLRASYLSASHPAIIIGKDSGKADGGAGSQLKYRKQPHAK
jgi:hypothetical protein